MHTATRIAAAAALALLAGAQARASDLSGASASGYATGTFQIGCTTCPHYVLQMDGNPTPYEGGPGATSAQVDYQGHPDRVASGVPVDYTLSGGATLAADARFEGALATPLLGARVSADNEQAFLIINGQMVGIDYYDVIATAETVQRYTYTGTGSATYTFHFTVDGTVEDSRSSIGGSAGFFDDSLEVSYAFGNVSRQGEAIDSPPTSFSDGFDLTMTFNAGESFYMRAWLTALVTGTYASGDAFADASHTMRVSSVTGGDTSLLLTSVSAVPEPANWALLALGLATFLASRRFRATNSLRSA